MSVMRTVGVITGLMLLAAGLFWYTESLQADEPGQIGVLLTESSRLDKLEGIEDGLGDLGFHVEDDLVFHVYEEEEDTDALMALAGEMLAADYDLIAAFGGIEAQVLEVAMAETGLSTPVVFVGMAAPLDTGIIESYERPGTMFTGVANHHLNLSAKRLELFTDALPEMADVIVLYNEGIDISRRSLDVTLEAADTLGIGVVPFDVGTDLDLTALADLAGENTGLLTLPSFIIEGITEELVDFSLAHELPVMGIYDDEVAEGFLMAYGSSFYDQGYQAARQISLILGGNEASTIPVELPDRLLFQVNRDTAAHIGVSLDRDVMRLADEVKGGRD